jgi:hypothetical protein
MNNKEAGNEIGRAVFPRLSAQLEWLAQRKKHIVLELNSYDVYGVNTQYPTDTVNFELKLGAVLEDMLLAAELPYILFPIFRPDMNTLRFYARVRYRNP